MLNKFRRFKESKYAMVLVVIIAIPFVLWGMGGAFQSGKTNSVGKINNHNISTKEFLDHISTSQLDDKYIRKNIENGVLEEILRDLVSEKIINFEINNFGISISDKLLADKIKQNPLFHDENKIFSRIKYEKFLLERNISAPDYEMIFKKNELKNILFSYISKGIISPYFIANQKYIDQTKKIDVKYISLNDVYKKDFTESEIKKYIKNNENSLKRDEIDISYIKLFPEILVESKDYNKEFFNIIDQIEDMILNGSKINQIAEKYNLKKKDIYNYYFRENNNDEDVEILNEIYSSRNSDKIKIIDKNDYLLLYEIKNKIEKLPKLNDDNFLKIVNKKILNDEKINLHKKLFEKIKNKEINENIFISLVKNNNLISKITLNSIKDVNLFDENSIKLIYSMPKNSYILISDNKKNIYFAKILNINFTNLKKSEKKNNLYFVMGNDHIKNNLYRSYDSYLNNKYKVEINENTLNRIKNYFE